MTPIAQTTRRLEPRTARPRRIPVSWTALALVLALLPAQAGADAIRLHDQMGVQAEEVKLRHVAELTGDQAAALGDTVVGTFDGRERMVVTLRDVRRALADAGVNWGMMTLRGHRQCEVLRLEPTEPDAAATNKGEPAENEADDQKPVVASNIDQPVRSQDEPTLRGRIERVIAELAGVEREKLRIDFRPHDERRLEDKTWSGRFEVEPGATSAIGRVPLTVRQYRGGRPVETFTLTADVQRSVEAVVATRRVRRNERFEAGDIERRTVWLDHDREPLAETELVVGQRAGTSVRSGSPIYADDVREPVLIRRGELVTVRAVSGGLVVRTAARAAEEGAMDEIIRLRNEGSRENFYATVTGRREATVALDEDGPESQGDGSVQMSLTAGQDTNDAGGER